MHCICCFSSCCWGQRTVQSSSIISICKDMVKCSPTKTISLNTGDGPLCSRFLPEMRSAKTCGLRRKSQQSCIYYRVFRKLSIVNSRCLWAIPHNSCVQIALSGFCRIGQTPPGSRSGFRGFLDGRTEASASKKCAGNCAVLP